MMKEVPTLNDDAKAAQIKEYLLSLMSQLITAMEDDDRKIIVLHEIEGIGLQQIASQMQLPLNTVKTRIRRARLKLKERMEASFNEID
jgi:RNA polymerase sigma-70 factor (ECF subfamily)